VTVIAGIHPTVISIAGAPAFPVRDVAIRGLRIEHTACSTFSGGFGAVEFEGAVQLSYAVDCTLEELSILNVAGQGIKMRPGGDVRGTTVRRCRIASCGASGIIAPGRMATIEANHVYQTGVFFPSAVGIGLGGDDAVIAHNEVHDCTYNGISYGGNRNRIEHNLLYRCMRELADGGAVYCYGAQDCTIANNVIRDVGGDNGSGRHRAAVSIDEQSVGTVIRDNVAADVDTPFILHMARDCTVEGNIVASDRDLSIITSGCDDMVMSGNAVYSRGSIEIRGIDQYGAWERNLVYSQRGTLRFVETPREGPPKEVAAPAGTTVQDPLFVDAAAGDLRFQEASPAHRLGIRPVDIHAAGRPRVSLGTEP
jgi:hypothetical protein